MAESPMPESRVLPTEDDQNIQEIRKRIGGAKKAIAEYLEKGRGRSAETADESVAEGEAADFNAGGEMAGRSKDAAVEVAVKAAVAERLADIERAREKMKHDQEEIGRLKFETRVMIAKLHGMTMMADVWRALTTHVALAEDQQRCYAEIKEIRQELRELAAIVHDLARGIDHPGGTREE